MFYFKNFGHQMPLHIGYLLCKLNKFSNMSVKRAFYYSAGRLWLVMKAPKLLI